MARKIIFVLFAILQITKGESDKSSNKTKPLVLTDLIQKDLINEARAKSSVNCSMFLNKTSFSGYIRVNKQHDSHLFFWFFPAEKDYQTAPVVLWLQGGPGDTTLISVFYETGPFTLRSDLTLEENKYSWTKFASIIYIDNPVGTGFSYTRDGYAENQTRIGEELFEALQQFFKVFHEVSSNEFFVSGESYGGKYAMAVAHTIHRRNPTAALKINLKGITSGNGVVDPAHEVKYAEYYYQIGLIDFNAREKMLKLEEKASEAIKKQHYMQGLDYMFQIVLSTSDSIFSKESGFGPIIYNLLHWNYTVNYTDIRNFVRKPEIRTALHVGNETFHVGGTVLYHLLDETMVSVASWLSELLSHYRVLVYNGQLDLIVPYPITLNYLRNLNFSGAKEYKTATRSQWRIGGDLAGYVKHAGNLTEVLVRNAGHMAVHDQPAWLYDLFTKFLSNKQIS